MDPKLTLKLFTKNAYFATKTPRKHLDHQKKKKFKKNFFPQNDSIRRENRSRNFFGTFLVIFLVFLITKYQIWSLIYIIWQGYSHHN